MPSLKDIRNRIGSVKNTKKITSAMKLVAAAKLRRAEEAVKAARPYALKMAEVIAELVDRVDDDAHPLLVSPEQEEHFLVVLITSNRGLCGGFNANLLRAVDRFIDDRLDLATSASLITVGRKGYQHMRRRDDIEIAANFPEVIGDIDFEAAKAIAQEAMERFRSGEVDRVYLVYNEFISVIQTSQIILQLLPLSSEAAGESGESGESGEDEALIERDAEAPASDSDDYIYEPDEQALLERLLPNSVEIQIFQALLESEAAEQGSRMTAMDNATSNAEEMIDDLTLEYNRARQAYITKELVEIVSGAESLKG